MKTNQQIAEELTREDFITDKWDTHGINNWYRFKKLTPKQIDKYFEASKFIGYEMEYIRGTKVRKCILVAVTLPKQLTIVYPTGEMHNSGKEFANKYSSHPFDFRVSLLNDNGESTDSFWSSKIDSLLLDKVGEHCETQPLLFENWEASKVKYIW